MTRPLVHGPPARREDAALLSGRGCFVDDLQLPGMLHAAVLRSPHAHGDIVELDVSQAAALPGVVAVLTAADFGGSMPRIPIRLQPFDGLERMLQTPLAEGKVRYVGEPVAMVVAQDRYVAEDALECIMLDIAPQPAVIDADAALADDTILHAAAGSNVACRYTVARGTPADAMARAVYRRTARFRSHRHTALPLETRGLVAEWTAADRARLWGAAKVTYFNRDALAAAFGLAPEALELIELDVGGSFGVRGELYPEDYLVLLAARRLGRPVKWIEDRREHLAATNHSRDVVCEVTLGLDAEGRFLAMTGTVHADLGAYIRTNAAVVASRAAQFLPGPYRIEHAEFDVAMLMTSKTPVGTLRGPGRVEANFFRERLIDMIATDIGMDPIDLRRRNLLTAADMPYAIGRLVPNEGPGEYDGGDYLAGLDGLLEAFGWEERRALQGREIEGRRHGIGVGCFVESSGGRSPETARLSVRADGRVALDIGVCAVGQGVQSTMAVIAGEALGIDPARVDVRHGTTSLLPSGGGTFHARSVVIGGACVVAAAGRLKAEAVRLAALRLNRSEADLVWQDGSVCQAAEEDGTGAVLDLAQLSAIATELGQELQVLEVHHPKATTYSYGAHAAHVAVDPATGFVEVLGYLALEDVGRAVMPQLVHGQAIGAAVQGLGEVFLEQIVHDAEGQLLTGSLADYLVPVATDFPAVDAITWERAASPSNPLGAKGAGEGGIIATAAAIGNAVSAALAPLGVSLTETLITPDVLRRAIRAAEAGEDPRKDET